MPNNLMQSNFPRERVIRRFREWIDHGRLITGERLPAEGSIAVEFGVSRGTVRAALKQLEEDGLLESRRHCGRVVAASATGAKLLAKSFMLISDIQPNPEVHAGDLPLGAMMMGIMTEATVAGLHPVVLGRAGLTDGYFETILGGGARGVVVGDGFSEDADCLRGLNMARDRGIPVVVFGDGEGVSTFTRIVSDHESGSKLLTTFLVRHGCRRILRIWSFPDTPYWLAARNRGYEQAMTSAGLPLLPAVAIGRLEDRGNGDRANFEKRVRTYAGYLAEHLSRKEPIDGLLLTNDSDCFPAAAACRLFGKEPGKDIHLCGYDNFWGSCRERELEKSLPSATIDKRDFEMGSALFRALLARISSRPARSATGKCTMVEPKLVVLVKGNANRGEEK